jgi:hypothetical protein
LTVGTEDGSCYGIGMSPEKGFGVRYSLERCKQRTPGFNGIGNSTGLHAEQQGQWAIVHE